MIFAHRGLVTKDSPENSISSLEEAHKSGFRGIEFDLWFVEGEIFISHDQPQNKSLPTLRDYFRYGNEMSYWLDFKNLNDVNAEAAIDLVVREIKRAGIELKKVFFVPCILNDFALVARLEKLFREKFADELQFGLICREENLLQDLEEFCAHHQVEILSILQSLIDENFVRRFAGKRIFAWTVNEENRLKELESLGVQDFASDVVF